MRDNLLAFIVFGFIAVAGVALADSGRNMATVITDRLVVWKNPYTQEPTYVAHCRRAREGCEERINRYAGYILASSNRHNVDPWLVAALAWHETRWHPNAVGPVGEFGLIQLHPRSPWGREARKLCRHTSKMDCEALTVDIGVRTLAASIKTCGNVAEGLGRYNTGKCVVNKYSKKVRRYKKDFTKSLTK